ncbi:LysR family transcriptional regulator [Sphingorhabdus sp.]|uniref:LysR family transcriptional regulator n=1 Tax=Sphingorhabdus sp. TaxID=1902408 RepID=UPI00391B8795
MKLPDFEAWSIFACVVEHKSFTGAAQALGRSKATISKAVMRLENQVGAPLFHRTSRRLSLTESGNKLVEHARSILSEGQAAEEAARGEASEPVGLVRLAVPMSFGLKQVGPVIADFLCANRGISVDMHLSDAKVDLIGDGFDIGLRIAALPDSSLRVRKLRDVKTYIVAAPVYLERMGTPRHPAELVKHECLQYSLLTAPDHWRFTNEAGEDVSARPRGRLRANNSDAMLHSLRSGLGIAVVPDFIVSEDLATGAVIEILNDWQPPVVALHLVTPPGTIRPQRVTTLIDYLVAQFGR